MMLTLLNLQKSVTLREAAATHCAAGCGADRRQIV